MSGTFDFALASRVAEETAPDEAAAATFRGWEFTAKPNIPYRPKFKVTLYGMRWYLNTDGTYDVTTNPTMNAARFRAFYLANRTWDAFNYAHESLGNLVCRFSSPPLFPPGEQNGFGVIKTMEAVIVVNNPGY